MIKMNKIAHLIKKAFNCGHVLIFARHTKTLYHFMTFTHIFNILNIYIEGFNNKKVMCDYS